jgi:hypothetical protein
MSGRRIATTHFIDMQNKKYYFYALFGVEQIVPDYLLIKNFRKTGRLFSERISSQ